MIKGMFFLERITESSISLLLDLRVNAVFSAYGNLDEQITSILRMNGIQVYAEVSLFFMNDIWETYPQSQPIDRDGKPMHQIHWYTGACPNQSDLRADKIQFIKELLKGYNIDGILLDFIRYPCHWEEVRSPDIKEYCFCPVCLEKFQHEVGVKPEGEPWISWKCRQITQYVREIREVLNDNMLDVKLGMFTVPWRDKDFNRAMRGIIGQDVNELSEYIDIFCPMTYHKLSAQPVSWIGDTVRYFDDATGKLILPCIQTMDSPVEVSPLEFEQSFEQALQKPSAGVLVFHFEDLMKNNEKEQLVKSVFERY
jgi:uncharacterized lipoprotein YddW (UPF0748 family)